MTTQIVNGLDVSGEIGGTGFRPDSVIRASDTDCLVSLYATLTGINHESAIAYGQPLVNGAPAKTASVSAKWSNNDSSTGYGVLRLNATYSAGNGDDVALRIYGGRGIVVWGGGNDAAPPGANKMQIFGADGKYGTLYVENGALKYQGFNGTVTTIAAA